MKFKLMNEDLEDKFIESERYDWIEDEDEEESEWEKVKSKSVIDEDGFTTEYVWYKGINPDTNKIIHIFMFGDSDINEPSIEYADWTADSELEAREWFDNYESGYKSEEDIEADEDEEWEALLKQWEEEDRENGLFDDEETLSEDKKDKSNTVQTMIGLKGDMDEDLKEEDTETRECEWCGKEFEINKDSDETYCPKCRYGVRVGADIDEDIKSDYSESEFAKKYPDRFAKLDKLFDKNGLEKISAKDLDEIAIILGVDLSKTEDVTDPNSLEEDFEDEHIGKSTKDKKEDAEETKEEDNSHIVVDDWDSIEVEDDENVDIKESFKLFQQANSINTETPTTPIPANLQPIITNKLDTTTDHPQIISESATPQPSVQEGSNYFDTLNMADDFGANEDF